MIQYLYGRLSQGQYCQEVNHYHDLYLNRSKKDRCIEQTKRTIFMRKERTAEPHLLSDSEDKHHHLHSNLLSVDQEHQKNKNDRVKVEH